MAIRTLLGVGAAAATALMFVPAPLGANPSAITLATSKKVATYGALPKLTGVVSGVAPGRRVQLTAKACGTKSFVRFNDPVVVQGGRFGEIVPTPVTVTYVAREGSTKSEEVTVKVRPLVRLTKSGSRYTVRITAGVSYEQVYVIAERKNGPAWRPVRKVQLEPGASLDKPYPGTHLTTATFEMGRSGPTRVVLDEWASGPCYAAAASNVVL
jgi:hypothetical protein